MCLPLSKNQCRRKIILWKPFKKAPGSSCRESQTQWSAKTKQTRDCKFQVAKRVENSWLNLYCCLCLPPAFTWQMLQLSQGFPLDWSADAMCLSTQTADLLRNLWNDELSRRSVLLHANGLLTNAFNVPRLFEAALVWSSCLGKVYIPHRKYYSLLW